ncbi:MAG: hypothetical protein V1794_17985 [Candidatus Glassbacteria bacterium]
MEPGELEKIIVNFISKGHDGIKIQDFKRQIKEEIKEERFRLPFYVSQALWNLVSRGLIIFDIISDNSPQTWSLSLTPAGKAVADGERFNPNDLYGYSKMIEEDLLNISEVEKIYMTEALMAYQSKLYISSVVMAGVVAEKAYLDLAETFIHWPEFSSSPKVVNELTDPRGIFKIKKNRLLDLINQYNTVIPDELLEGVGEIISAMLELVRVTRNEAGHPKGIQISQKRANATLQWLPYALEKIHALKLYFKSKAN